MRDKRSGQQQACTTLARWDTRADTASRGTALWITFFNRLLDNGPPDTWRRVPYDPAQPLTTPRGINGVDVRVQHALADAVQDFAARDLPVDGPASRCPAATWAASTSWTPAPTRAPAPRPPAPSAAAS
ncbi:penicillin acylase family protein [Streptomyces mirabilis]|uniref:penicillin acylase family protein n=1 Tax=Streptomyces mirabilis TaxID=68239 RepID=UPI0036B97834